MPSFVQDLNKMPSPAILATLTTTALLILAGCGSSEKSANTESASRPTVSIDSIVVGSLTISGQRQKTAREDVEGLVRIMNEERLDVLMIQGMTRYPGVPGRIDLLFELQRNTGWHTAFGKTIDNSGRVDGNAIISSLPILSDTNFTYQGFRSMKFESALRATIDGGLREVMLLSTLLPGELTAEEKLLAVKSIQAFSRTAPDKVVIAAGNLFAEKDLRFIGFFEDAATVTRADSALNPSSRIWYRDLDECDIASAKVVQSSLGNILIGTFHLFRSSR